MSRRILCQSCGDKWKPHPQDVREGWQYRVLHVSLKKPDDHSVQVVTDATADGLMDLITKGVPKCAGKITPLPSIYCDTCGEPIADGTVALAVTMWRDNPVGEWEHEYGTVIPPEAAQMELALTKERL